MKIYLERDRFARLESKETQIVIEGKPFTLDFTSSYDLSSALINLKNGAVTETCKYVRGFVVPEKLVIAGRITGSVEMYVNGELAKVWQIPPICLKEINPVAFKAFGELDHLYSKIDTLEKKLNELSEKTDKYFNDII